MTRLYLWWTQGAHGAMILPEPVWGKRHVGHEFDSIICVVFGV